MKNVLNIHVCNNCGDKKYTTLYSHHDNNYYVDKKIFTLGRCRTCGLVRIVNPPAPYEIGRYYPATEYYAYATKKSVLFEAKRKFYNFVSRLPRRLATYLAFNDLYFVPDVPNASVLDIGCGDGSGLLLLKSLGYSHLSGTEISEESCQVIGEKGINMYCGSDICAIPIKEKFDAIRMNHSLEHVYNPKSTISTCDRLLRDGGSLYIAVPNYGSVAARLFGKFYCGLQLPTHLYHFDKKTIRTMVESGGFTIVKSRTVGLSGLSYSMKTMLKDRYGKSISEAAFLPVLVVMIPLELLLNVLGQGFMMNIHAKKDIK